jgi:hypothetical protein
MLPSTDVYGAMKPLFCVAQLAGLAPYVYVRSEQTGAESLDISRRRNLKKIVWGLVLLCVQLVGLVYKLAQGFTSPPDSLMDLVNDNIQLPFFSAVSIGALVLALTVNGKKMSAFIATLSVVDTSLLDDKRTYRKHRARLTAAVACATLFSVTIFCFDIHYYYTYNTLYIITIYLPDYIWTINELQFMNLVETLTVRLRALNGHFSFVFPEETSTGRSPRNFRKSPVRFVRTRVHVSAIEAELSRQARAECKASDAQTRARRSEVTRDTYRLIGTYDKLYDLSRLINSMFGYSLLVQFAAYTVCMVADGYNLACYLVALYRAEDPRIPPEGCPALILWNLSNLLRLFVICLTCQRASNEVRATVNQTEVLKLQPHLGADALRQLTIFSKQVEQCKIEFTACDFFDINLSQFFAVVLTATSYIAMLVLLER